MLEKENFHEKTALFITALFGASLANAHNVWLSLLKGCKGQYVVKFGHEETETYPQSKLKRYAYSMLRPLAKCHIELYRRRSTLCRT